MDTSDRAALKIHGYLFSSESSSDNDENIISDPVSKRNHGRRKHRPNTPWLTDSDQSSGSSDFDDDYYAIQPPPISIKNFKDRIIKIKAKTNHGHHRSKNAWNICSQNNTTNDFDHVDTQQVIAKKKTNIKSALLTEEALNISKISTSKASFNYLEEFPPLPVNKKNRITDTRIFTKGFDTYNNYLSEFPPLETTIDYNPQECLSCVEAHENDSIAKISLTGTIKKYSHLSEVPPKATDSNNSLQKIKSLPQVGNTISNPTSLSDAAVLAVVECSVSSPEVLQNAESFNCLQEIEFLPQVENTISNHTSLSDAAVSAAVECSVSSLEAPQNDESFNCIQGVESLPQPSENTITNEAAPRSIAIESYSYITKIPDFFTENQKMDEILPLIYYRSGLGLLESIDSLAFLKSKQKMPQKTKTEQKSMKEIELQRVTTESMKSTPKKSKSVRQNQLQGVTRHQNKQESKPDKQKILQQPNHKVTPETGPIFKKKTDCDTKDNLYIAHRKIQNLIRHQLVRNNNANLTRVRLAGERRRRRFYIQLDRVTDNERANAILLKGGISLFIITYLFYSLTSFLNMYIRNIFGICNND